MSAAVTLVSSTKVDDILDTGERLLDEHYDGVPFGWRDGKLSLRQLATQYEVSLTSLYRCMAITSMWVQCDRPRLVHLGVSHLRELVSLQPDDQRDLLTRAEQDAWSVQRVRKACKSRDRLGDVRTGRTARKAPSPILELVTRWVSNHDGEDNFEFLDTMSALERRVLLKHVQRLGMELEILERRLMNER